MLVIWAKQEYLSWQSVKSGVGTNTANCLRMVTYLASSINLCVKPRNPLFRKFGPVGRLSKSRIEPDSSNRLRFSQMTRFWCNFGEIVESQAFMDWRGELSLPAEVVLLSEYLPPEGSSCATNVEYPSIFSVLM